MLRFFILQFVSVLAWFYQKTISLDHGPLRKITGAPRCKFHPTCSEYAKGVLLKYGVVRGTGKTAWRLLRCNPWSKGGVDSP